MRTLAYPTPPRVDLVETLHGVPIADPFRRLEAADDPETAAWVDAENTLTRQVLGGADRDALVARLRRLHHYTRAAAPAVRGDRLFFTENDGSRNQPILYVTLSDASGAPGPKQVVVDPNLADESGVVALTAFEPSGDGALVVYALSGGGSDMQELAIRDVDRGVDRADRIRWVKFASLAWTDEGFFYTRFPEPGTVPPGREQYFCQVWFHRLGDPQTADRLVYERPDLPEAVFEVDVTSDGAHLVVTSHRGASDDAEVLVGFLGQAGREGQVGQVGLQPLVVGFEHGWHFIGGRDGHLFFFTDSAAPLGRIVRFDLDSATPLVAHGIVAESGDKIADAIVANGQLIVSTLHNASGRLLVFGLDGEALGDIPLPGIGTIVSLAGEWNASTAYVNYTSFTEPPTILQISLKVIGVLKVLRVLKVLEPGEPREPREPREPGEPRFLTEQVWYPSEDGTPVSMFLVSRRGDSGPRPVLLTGYGGFNISLTPTFDPSDALWLEAGGVLAVANLRGGGEYGDSWHRAGMLDRKQNVFDDFIAAAEWLVASGRGAPGRIAIEGGSNGGLLVGACMVQRPDLFGAVICRVPVADMLRYHLFTVGRFWIPEYGSADDPAQFAVLRKYSPYHNVADGARYPPTLVMTADTDDRVAPGMAKKFAARLQEAVAADGGPILLRVETRAGHGAGKPIVKQIDEQADIYAFLFQHVTRASASERGRPASADVDMKM